jgi:hypothetical protein
MKPAFLTLFFILGALLTGNAQSKQTTLTGTLTMQTGEVFPYKLVFTDSGKVIKGYSLTYKEPDETKTAIRGTLDRQMRTLTFKEKDIISSHNVQTKAYMCLVDASLDYVQDGSGKALKGPAISRETDNTSCTPGEIVFNDAKELDNLFSYHEQFDTIITMKKKVKEPVAAAPEPIAAEPIEQDKVTAGIDKSYEWHTDTVVLDIWDGGTVDGDQVTIQFNGKPVLTNYSLVKEKKQLRLPIKGTDVNTLLITAINEGFDPPNTASLILTDGTIKYSILAYNKKGNAALIKIKRVK